MKRLLLLLAMGLFKMLFYVPHLVLEALSVWASLLIQLVFAVLSALNLKANRLLR